MISAGKLNKIVRFQTPNTKTQNDFGEDVITYKLAFATKARVVFNAENREVVNDEIVYPNTITITIRNTKTVSNDMIVVFNNKNYRILSIDDTITGEINIKAELIND